jgi:thioredoxin 1
MYALCTLLLVQCCVIVYSRGIHTQSVTPFIQFSPVTNVQIETSFASFSKASIDQVQTTATSTFPTVTDIPPSAHATVLVDDVMSVTVAGQEESILAASRDDFAEKTRICEYLGWEEDAAVAALRAARGNVTAALLLLDSDSDSGGEGGRSPRNTSPPSPPAPSPPKETTAASSTRNITDSSTSSTAGSAVSSDLSSMPSMTAALDVTKRNNSSMLTGTTGSADSQSSRGTSSSSEISSSESSSSGDRGGGGVLDLQSPRELQAAVLSSAVPVLLQLHAPWCGPCRQLSPLLRDLAASLNSPERGAGAGAGAGGQGEGVRLVRVDVDARPLRALAGSVLRVEKLPTLLLLHRGRILKR